jgi:anthranilate 1,2-dioxygenase large subunit/terephthalate 1,2-dioxygenase oxygenase component alpha subunit
VNAFENRCAHRGSIVCLKSHGNAARLTCVYHSWSYDLAGNLTGVAFRAGVDGKGGMPADFKLGDHGLRKLAVATYCGLVFGSFSHDMPVIEEYLGPQIAARVRRVLNRPVRVLGRYTQELPGNWKLYMENVKDTYHASLLHMFFATFHIGRLTQRGGILVDESGGHHASYSMMNTEKEGGEYDSGTLRANKAGYSLADPSMLEGWDEFGDGITLQMLTVFPTFVLQQVRNSLAVRQIVALGPERMELNWTFIGFADDDEATTARRLKQANLVGPGGYISMEDGAVCGFVQRTTAGAAGGESVVEMGGEGTGSQETRATEAAVRGFWKAYRERMAL